MEPFGKSEEVELYDDKYQTNDICPKTGYWICADHPAIKVFVKEGDYLPKCPQRVHSTIWYRIMNRNETIK
jgi:hypothetical protein